MRNSPVKRVIQGDQTGCGVACVAMVAGLNYDEAKQLFVERVFKRNKRVYWTRHKDIESALGCLGIESSRVWFRGWSEFSGTGIVPVDRDKSTKRFHWIVATKRGSAVRLYDPESPSPYARVILGRPSVRGYYISLPDL